MYSEAIKNVSLNLIREVTDLCNENNINYFFVGDAVIKLYRDKELPINPSIAINISDVDKFISVVNNKLPDNSGFDYIKTNPNFPSFFFRYSDLNTLDCSLEDYVNYKFNCLHIDIKVIKGTRKGGTAGKLKFMFYNLYKMSNVTSTRNKSIKYKGFRQIAKIIRGIIGKKKSANIAFRSFKNIYSGNSKTVSIDKYKYDSLLFKKKNELIISGCNVSLPSDIEKYLIETYGINWMETVVDEYDMSQDRIVSCNISWGQFKRRLDDVNFDKYYMVLKQYSRANRMFSIYNRKVNGYYNLIERTNDRFLLYTEFMSQKNRIMELYDNKDYEKLNKILAPYISCLNKNYKRGLGLCFDKDIFNVTMELYKHNGNEKMAYRLRKLVPESHWEPIKIKNYKGEIIN